MNAEVTAGLRILTSVGLITVQDAGRVGSMARGVPPGGALVPELLARANRAVGNRWCEAALEIVGRLRVEAIGSIAVGDESGTRRRLAPGERLEIAPLDHARARYLAIEGGLDVPVLLGSRSTLVSSGLGGLEGRILRRDDRLMARDGHDAREAGGESADRDDRAWWVGDPREEIVPFDVVPGPDVELFPEGALERFLAGEFTISPRSDRVGLRLDGDVIPVASDTRVSMPMVRGAIEIPADGSPIVLGPEHPTTGGYPVLAVVVSTELGRLFSRKAGRGVRFAAIGAEAARRRWKVLLTSVHEPRMTSPSSQPPAAQPLVHVRRIHRRDLNQAWEFLKLCFRAVNRETVEYQRPRSKKRFLEVYEEEGIEQLLFEVDVEAESKSEIVGYAECAFEIIGTDNWMNERYFSKRDMRPLFVEELAVHPDYAGRGIGSFVLEQLEHLARVRGCTHMVLEVAENNDRALRFYRGRSFYKMDAALFLAKKVTVDAELLPPREVKPPRPAPTKPPRASSTKPPTNRASKGKAKAILARPIGELSEPTRSLRPADDLPVAEPVVDVPDLTTSADAPAGARGPRKIAKKPAPAKGVKPSKR